MSALDDWKAVDAAPITSREAAAASNSLQRAARSAKCVSSPDEVERLARRSARFSSLSRRLAQQARDKAARVR